MNLPNKLTVLRMIMIPIFIVLFFVNFPYHYFAATAVFIIASLTDMLDGHIARKYNLITDLGKFLDPIADKMLVSSALIAVVAYCANLTQWITITITIFTMIILCRELMVSGFRIVASSKNVILAADKLGKIKTILQMFAMILLIPAGDYLTLFEGHGADFYGLGSNNLAASVIFYIGYALLAAATILTVISGMNYIVKNKGVLKNE